MACTQFNTKVQVLRSDNDIEHMDGTFQSYLDDHDIVHQIGCIDTPHQNGIAKWKNQHLLKVTRSLMFTMNVPKFNWGDVVLIATYLINRMPLRVMNFKSLVELLQGVCSIIVSFEVFGCVCLFDIIDKQWKN